MTTSTVDRTNMSPSIEWQTVISHLSSADETHHSFDRHFYSTVQNNFLRWTLAHRKGQSDRSRVRQENIPNTWVPPVLSNLTISGWSILSPGETFLKRCPSWRVFTFLSPDETFLKRCPSWRVFTFRSPGETFLKRCPSWRVFTFLSPGETFLKRCPSWRVFTFLSPVEAFIERCPSRRVFTFLSPGETFIKRCPSWRVFTFHSLSNQN